MNKRAKGLIAGLIAIFALVFLGAYLLLKDKYVPPILMYHKVDQDYQVSKLSVSPESFEREMEFISRHYNCISLRKLAILIKNKQPVPPHTVVITFDDGYENNYTNAFPILKKYNLKATIFLILEKIGQEGYLSWEQIKEMQRSGLIDFGSHTISHQNLTRIPLEVAWQEIYQSKHLLQELTGVEVEVFAYPAGGFNQQIKELVQQAGYLAAVATSPGERYPSDDIYALKRVRISRTSSNPWVFWLYSSGYYTWIKEMRDEE